MMIEKKKYVIRKATQKEVENHDWINCDRIRKAINSFSLKKAPGLDQITPESSI